MNPAFALDGHRIYFLSRAWATSWALHVYDLADGTERFIRSAASFEVISRGRFSGCLLITDHTYSDHTRTLHYPHMVVTAQGVEIVNVGDDGAEDPRLAAWRQQFMPASLGVPARSSASEQEAHDARC